LDPEFSVRDSRGGTRSALNKKRIVRIAQLTLAAVAALILTGNAEARNHPSNKIILVRPTELPELARVAGQAMLLHETGDGRTLLYIEQDHGARPAIFDVTDPAHVKQEGSAQVEAPGSFDFVSSITKLGIQRMFAIIYPRGPEPRGAAGVLLRFLREKRDRGK
jgi:hypothetical protein